MSRDQTFAGALAPLVVDSMGPKSFLSGAVVLGGMVAVGVLCRTAGLPQAAVPLWVAVGSIAVARIALNSAFGSLPGGLFESTGGSWAEVLQAAARMILLNLVWALPVGLAFAGWTHGLRGLPVAGPELLLLLGAMAVPPLAAVIGAGSGSVAAAFAPAGWRALLAGRGADLMTLWVVCTGGALSTFAGATILAVALGRDSMTFGLFVMMAAGAWALGVTLHLYGRTVGGFLRTAHVQEVAAPASPSVPPRLIDFDPTPYGSSEDSGAVSPFGALGPTASPLSVPDPLPVAVPSRHAPRPALDVAHSSVALATEVTEGVDLDSVSGRLRANARIEDDDRDLALEDAEHLVGKFGPHPQVLARVAVLKHRLRHEDALDAARRAADAARVVNNAGVLADLYEEFRAALDALELTEIERQRMAASLATRDHFPAAIDLYDSILGQNPQNLPVVKAMIKLAEDGLRSEEGAERALRLYGVIESRWPDHPFVEFVDRGREEVRRKLERAAH